MNKINKLFYGDNLENLRKYIRDETVDLCYIDPPFNSKRNYNQIYNNIGSEDRAQAQAFMDTWTWNDHANECLADIMENKNGVQTAQSIALIDGLGKVLGCSALFAYLVSMTVRIAEIHRTLKPTGSFYLHCDPTASHYLKLVCDALFVTRGGDFINENVWCYKSRHFSKKHFGRKHDIIFSFCKSNNYTFNWESILRPLSEVTIKKFKSKDEKGFYRLVGRGIKGSPIQSAKDVDPKWEKTHPHLVTRSYLKDGIPMEDYWKDIEGIEDEDYWDIDILNQSAKERLGYPTQKPEALLERIISASSNEGDTVLDAFCGCGTTVAVAQNLKRRWIGIDITYQSISLIMKRLRKIEGAPEMVEMHGIPRDMESVRALVHKKDDRLRKEFEKWAVLTYSDDKAVINEKKGADGGIDGVAYTVKSKDEYMPVLFSVKSGKVGREEISKLWGTVEREKAAAGILITLEKPTKPMIAEAKQAGQFKSDFTSFDRLQIVTVQEILENRRLNLPMSADVLKTAKSSSGARQLNLYV